MGESPIELTRSRFLKERSELWEQPLGSGLGAFQIQMHPIGS